MVFLQIARRRNVQLRSLKTALVVGTLLGLINYADAFLSATMTTVDWVKLLLTYVVPYSVSTWASVQAIRHKD